MGKDININELSEKLNKLEDQILAVNDISTAIYHSIVYSAENCLETGYLLTICEILLEKFTRILDEIDHITQTATILKIKYFNKQKP